MCQENSGPGSVSDFVLAIDPHLGPRGMCVKWSGRKRIPTELLCGCPSSIEPPPGGREGKKDSQPRPRSTQTLNLSKSPCPPL